MMKQARSKTTCNFLDLPAELRNKIYQYLLSTKYTKIELTYHEQGLGVSLSFISLYQLRDTNAIINLLS